MSALDSTTMPDTFADCGTGDGGSLPADPFTALRFHFGMLLGVDDFEVEQGFHHGKQRLHNAWLHRDGVVWGLGIEVDHGEIRVLSGLALDGAGRELHLDDPACLSVAAWYQEHAAEVNAQPNADGSVQFSGYVIARYATCPMRPVPALAEPCSGTTSETAYSRTYETVDIRFVPGPPPEAPPTPYHRLRVLFGLEAPTLPADQRAVTARNAALAAADRRAGFLAALDELAVLDTIDLRPAAEPDEPATRFPALDDSSVLLALVTGIRLVPIGDGGEGWTLTAGTVDYVGRRSLVATQTIQELLCGTEQPGGPTFTGNPVFNTGTNGTIVLTATAALEPSTVTPAAFSVSTFDGGWTVQSVDGVAIDATNTQVTLTVGDVPADQTIRIVASGTGPTPILADTLVPLGGGTDFVLMKRS